VPGPSACQTALVVRCMICPLAPPPTIASSNVVNVRNVGNAAAPLLAKIVPLVPGSCRATPVLLPTIAAYCVRLERPVPPFATLTGVVRLMLPVPVIVTSRLVFGPLCEHVTVIAACAALLKPGGRLFLSTLNRTPQAFVAAIAGAEYLLNLLPRGTHHHAQFIRPSELAGALRAAGLELEDVSGLAYNPFSRRARVTANTQVNYLTCAIKPA